MNPAQIVLVEDNPADVVLVELALKENDIAYSLTWFESGEDAIRVLCAVPTDDSFVPDAILLDLNTPRMDGFEALHRLRECQRVSEVPVAIITSSRNRGDEDHATSQGARYVEKPSQLNEFLKSVGQAVREMLGSR